MHRISFDRRVDRLVHVPPVAECRGCGDRLKIEGVTDSGHLNEFINQVAVRGRLLHLETEQDKVLPECEPLPRMAS